ncbi:XdhC family protein [Chitinasiproducens palmae]|uniref:Xanthine dehydrogenase accessory factor n=1 Tax=Chitinasiproducens palmae TaxID=1770053 RepID=A0A1H2PK52_9BURK|nr:XdhC family protein [Chitinasiproducens palmae]SDV46340.1 xanthine dehydrogenase accessory factor [Chitinasiproducens palmae]
MNSEDFDVLAHCAAWARDESPVVLATVVKTWGSSPRPEGAMLCIRGDGRVVGSVSGGCIEDDLIARFKRSESRPVRPEIVEYGVTADEARRFGLPCGGTIRLVLEPVSSESKIAALFEAVARGELIARTLDLRTGASSLRRASAAEAVTLVGNVLTTIHGPRYRMLVIGAGQLSRYFCEIARGLDYQITVCDPRDDYADDWQVAGSRLSREMPDDLVLQMRLDARCAVVALTHDPKLDDLALMEALRTPAFYVGALGSRRNNAMRRERLREFDLTEWQIARLRGPAGIYIGSKTPAEIAVSILAEVTAAKNGVDLADAMRVPAAKARLDDPSHFTAACSIAASAHL